MDWLSALGNAMLSACGQGMLWGVMALGVFITFKILNFADMTCDGSFALGACVSIVFTFTYQVNPFVTLLISIAAGMAAGFVTGFLHTKLKIPPILSGILTMIALYSINLRVMSDKSNLALQRKDRSVIDYISGIFPKTLTDGLKSSTVNYLVTVLLGIAAALLLIAVLYWFFGTEIGSALRATGNNEDMIRALGQNTDHMKILALVLSNGLIALSGALVAQQQRVADVGMGQGTIVIGLASIVIGEVLLGKKARSFKYKLLSVVVGSIIYRVIIAIVLQLGLKSTDLKLLTAVMVALALSIPVLTGSRRGGYKHAGRAGSLELEQARQNQEGQNVNN